jgi:hypothetical protein
MLRDNAGTTGFQVLEVVLESEKLFIQFEFAMGVFYTRHFETGVK